jgi:hypothetical protein
MTLEEITERYPDEEFLTADGFDEAIIGIDPQSLRLIYDRDMMISILCEKDGMEEVDAIEFLSFNTWGAYVGEKTPIYVEI